MEKISWTDRLVEQIALDTAALQDPIALLDSSAKPFFEGRIAAYRAEHRRLTEETHAERSDAL